MGKNNEKLMNWVKLAVTVMLALAAALYASGKFNGKITQRVDNIEKNLLDIEDACEIQDEANDAQDKIIVGVAKDVEHIKKAVDRIEGYLDVDRRRENRTQ